jgi:signal transduction histidine kinase
MSPANSHFTQTEIFEAKLTESFLKAKTSFDLIIPSEDLIVKFHYSRIFENLALMGTDHHVTIRVVCVFSPVTLKTIRQYYPFIQFKACKFDISTKRLTVIRDKEEVIIFGESTSRKLHETRLEQIRVEKKDENSFFLESVGTFDLTSDPLFVSCWVEVFEWLMARTEQYEALNVEKNYSEFLLDLLSHDVGNYHQIILLSIDDALAAAQEAKVLPSDDVYHNLEGSLRTAEDALHRGLRLVNNIKILEGLRRRQVRLESMDLLSSIEETSESLSNIRGFTGNSLSKKKLELRILPDPDYYEKERPHVLADNFLPEIFVNLFSNSIRNTNSQRVRVDIKIEKSLISTSSFWEITISDYGRGVPDELKAQLFEGYSTLSKRAGLGLSIVNSIVTSYGGQIWAEDRVFRDHTQGVIFGILLKAA